MAERLSNTLLLYYLTNVAVFRASARTFSGKLSTCGQLRLSSVESRATLNSMQAGCASTLFQPKYYRSLGDETGPSMDIRVGAELEALRLARARADPECSYFIT